MLGKLHREKSVLALYWPCTGLQCCLLSQSAITDVRLKLKNSYSCMSLYMRWPLTNFYTFSFFFREIVMRTRHPGGNGNFSPGKILAWGEITISPRVTSAHDDFTEKNRFCTYINSNRNRFSEWPLMSGIEISSSRGL